MAAQSAAMSITVQRKYQLGVHGPLGPQRAVVVEHRDAVPLVRTANMPREPLHSPRYGL